MSHKKLSIKEKLDIARKVKDRIKDPKNWTQRTHARNFNGVDIPLVLKYIACSICWSTAISYETSVYWEDPHFQEMHEEFLSDVKKVMLGARFLAQFNDKKTHEQVMEMCDITINRLQKELDALPD